MTRRSVKGPGYNCNTTIYAIDLFQTFSKRARDFFPPSISEGPGGDRHFATRARPRLTAARAYSKGLPATKGRISVLHRSMACLLGRHVLHFLKCVDTMGIFWAPSFKIMGFRAPATPLPLCGSHFCNRFKILTLIQQS